MQSVFAQELTLVFTGPFSPVRAGSRVPLSLNVLNPSARHVTWTFPKAISWRLRAQDTTAGGVLTVVDAAEPGTVTIAPGAFAHKEYGLSLPATLAGQVIVEFPGVAANPLLIEMLPATAASPGGEQPEKTGLAKLLQQAEPTAPDREFEPGRFLKEHLSGYEPFYFIAGTESPNAKFQISFKYQLLNNHGPGARHWPALKGFHVAYTQTSLWDWNQSSAPFLDSSYKPELLYLRERVVGGGPTNWFRLDLQTGLQHESNGKGGEDSRSLNIVYLRPTLTFGREDGLQFTLGPRAWVYAGDMSDNPDLARYRGYADLRATLGWKRGLQFSALGRLGDAAERGSLQLDLTYPMMTLLSGSFSVYLHAQYFTGYGESLLLYNERNSAFRVGFSLYR